jgi:hypothetical protein
MDSKTILKRLKLVENIKIELPNGKGNILDNLKSLTISDKSAMNTKLVNSGKKYAGEVGQDFFKIKLFNSSYKQILDTSAVGEITKTEETEVLDIEINGFLKKHFIAMSIMLPLFAIFLLFLENTASNQIFIAVMFLWLPFGLVLIMRIFKNKLKRSLLKDLK